MVRDMRIRNVICISDNDSSDDSDEAYEFEDIVVDQTANIGGFSEARFEEIVDETANDDATTLDRLSGETTSHSGVTSSPPPEEGDALERGDEGTATDREWDLLDDESSSTEPADPAREDSHTPGPLDPKYASLGDIFVELAALRGRVAQLEAWMATAGYFARECLRMAIIVCSKCKGVARRVERRERFAGDEGRMAEPLYT